jgi:ABC-type multidrug transport system ATPase subunit
VTFQDRETVMEPLRPSFRQSSSAKNNDSTKSLEDVHATFTLTWRDLCYDVKGKRVAKKKQKKPERQPEQQQQQQPVYQNGHGISHVDDLSGEQQDQSTSMGEVSTTEMNGHGLANHVDEPTESDRKRDEEVTEPPADKADVVPAIPPTPQKPEEGGRGGSRRRSIFRPRPRPMKRILHHVDGSVSPGEMVAILGPSGSGKTTLLNLLAGRVSSGVVTGSILANGEKRSKFYYTNMAYVEQDDLMFATLTVFETLLVAARLRLPRSFSKESKLQRVDEVIQELGLNPCRNTYIGGPELRGISGGERKRTAIAVELLRNPSLLFLDEPTSGLDSSTAFNIVESLQNLARRQRTVLMTIHQPKANIFELFDKAIFLSQGKVVYFGPVSEVVPYFSSANYPCPRYTNPADHYMDVITIDPRSIEAQEQSQQALNELVHYYNENRRPQVRQKIDQLIESSRGTGAPEGFKTRKYQATYWEEFLVLAGRSWKNFIRNKRLSIYALVQTLVLAVIIGAVFFSAGRRTGPVSVQNRLGALFFVILNQSFTTLFPVLNVFPPEIAVFKRERAARAYRVSTYYLAKNFAELPLQFAYPIIFGSIVYWMIGFAETAAAFFTFLAFMVVIAFTSQSLGILISAAVPDVTVANILAPLILIIFVLFGGFYSNTQSIWSGIAWIQWISYVNYAFKGLVQNEFNNVPGGAATISLYDAGAPSLWVDFVIIIGFGVFFRVLGCFVLAFRSRQRRQIA